MKNKYFEKINSYFDENKEYLFNTLAELIRINTENDRTTCNESKLTKDLKERYKKLGFDSELYTPDSVKKATVHPDFTPGKDFSGRENLTAKLPGNSAKKALMLAAHADTMPIGDLSLWTIPPTEGIIKDGRIYGRGACDDKYALAAMLFLAKAVKDLKIDLKNDIYLTAYVDEEFGGGNGALAATLKYPCQFYLNLDCKNLDIWNVAAGGQRIALHFTHSKLQHSCEAMIEALYTAKKELDLFGQRRIKELKENKNFDNSIIPATAFRYMNMVTGLNTNDRHKGVLDFAFYTDKTREEIYAEFEELEKVMAEKLLPLGIIGDKFVPHTRFFHYTHCKPDAQAILDFSDAMFEALGKRPEVCGSCLSDLSVIGKFGGKCAFAYGAGRDFSLPGGAHQPNEFIECDKFVEFVKTIAAYVVKVLA